MSDIKFSLKRLLKKPDKTDDKDSNSRVVHTETGKNIGKDVGKETGDKIIKSDASPSPLHVAQSLPSPIPSPITSPAAVGQAQTPVGANNSSTLPNAPGENDELINKLSHKFDGLSSTKNGETVAPVVNSLTPVLSPNSISSDGSRSLQVPSDKNDKKSKSRNVSQTSSINGKVAKSGPYSVQNSNNITHVSSHSSLSSPAKERPRFKMLELGNHTHCLRAAKRQEKLSNMLKDLLGAKRLRDEAKSAIPVDLQNVVGNNASEKLSQTSSSVAKPPTLFSGLVHSMKLSGGEVNPSPSPSLVEMNSTSNDSRCFVEKYGRCQEVIGKGSFGVVRVSHKKVIGEKDAEEKLYAVKEFKRRPQESEKKYNRRLTSEFCISSSLKHLNIIDTLDLLKDAKGDYCEVMEYCAGGDLYTLIITAGKLEYAEADCFFKQLITGVNYMHDMGVSHRDLKPENILITQNGVLKITDFGNGECFRMAWEEQIQYSEGVCGSSPYIAPEEFTQQSFDPRKVDIWACGVIYMAMRTGRQLWKLADEKKDVFFEEYLVKRKEKGGYEPIESLKRARCRNVIYSILDPKPERRITGKQILNSEWGREIKVCDAGRGISPDASPITGPI